MSTERLIQECLWQLFHNRQELEATQMLISRQADKHIVVRSYDRLLHQINNNKLMRVATTRVALKSVLLS